MEYLEQSRYAAIVDVSIRLMMMKMMRTTTALGHVKKSNMH